MAKGHKKWAISGGKPQNNDEKKDREFIKDSWRFITEVGKPIILLFLLVISGFMAYMGINDFNWLYVIVAFIIFLFLSKGVYRNYEKFWFGLAIVLGVVAGLVAYFWILDIPPDKPIHLVAESADWGCQRSNYLPIRIIPPMNLKDFFAPNKITYSSDIEIGEYIDGKRDPPWIGNCSIICISADRVFREGENIFCYTALNITSNFTVISTDYDKKENGTYSKGNGTYYKKIDSRIHSKVHLCQYGDNYQQICTKVGDVWDRVPENFQIPLLNAGKQRLNISFFLYTQFDNRVNGNNEDDKLLIQYTGNIYVKSREEISRYEFIIALFAIVGIPSAIYFLRQLYRNKE